MRPMRSPPAPLPQRLFHLTGRVRGTLLLRAFEQAAQQAHKVDAETLRRILLANRECESGRRLGFARLAAEPGAYRRAVPLQRYDDVAPAIQRMASGEPAVLCSEPVLFFAQTSGTTGAAKLIPATAASFAWQRRYYTGLNPAVPARELPGGFDPHPGISLLSAAGTSRRTAGGTPVALASANGLSRVRRLAPYLWTSPWAVFEVAELEALWYLHALFGLRTRTAKFLNAVFAPHLLAWLRFVEARFDSLLRDIAQGSLPAELSLPPAQRSALLAQLSPDPQRAAELAQAAAPGFSGFVRRAWPWMRYAATVITGPFAAAVPGLRHYLSELPIHTTVLSASEGMLGLNLELARPERYVLCTGSAHFEFIPLSAVSGDQPQTRTLAELQRGDKYELVLTNFAGLYRYRMGDVVEVLGFHHQAPVLGFCYRLGSILDLVGEKTSEDQALAAVQQTIGHDNLVDYAAWPDALARPPRYVFYIEQRPLLSPAVDSSSAPAAQLADQLDDALCQANVGYAGYRSGGYRLAPPLVRLLRSGTFAALARLRLAQNPDAGSNQLKTPRLLKDERWRQFLEERVVSAPGATG